MACDIQGYQSLPKNCRAKTKHPSLKPKQTKHAINFTKTTYIKREREREKENLFENINKSSQDLTTIEEKNKSSLKKKGIGNCKILPYNRDGSTYR